MKNSGKCLHSKSDAVDWLKYRPNMSTTEMLQLQCSALNVEVNHIRATGFPALVSIFPKHRVFTCAIRVRGNVAGSAVVSGTQFPIPKI